MLAYAWRTQQFTVVCQNWISNISDEEQLMPTVFVFDGDIRRWWSSEDPEPGCLLSNGRIKWLLVWHRSAGCCGFYNFAQHCVLDGILWIFQTDAAPPFPASVRGGRRKCEKCLRRCGWIPSSPFAVRNKKQNIQPFHQHLMNWNDKRRNQWLEGP